ADVPVELRLHAFELNPDLPPDGEAIVDYAARKYGASPDEVAQRQAAIRRHGATAGLELAERSRVYNTFDAHRLLHWAGLEGRQLPLKMALFRAYFTESKDSSNHDVLVEAAAAAGLDAEKARTVLSGDTYAAEVQIGRAHV